jgi:hypothetical protein
MGCGMDVRCVACGYLAESLRGVGGQIGMTGRPVWTVACPKVQDLVDVWAPDDPASVERYWFRFEWGDLDVPCPECGEVHEVWDSRKGICPNCGAGACKTEFSGLMWD